MIFLVADRDSVRYLEKSFKKLTGRKDIEDALSRLERLTQEAVKIMKAVGTDEQKR
jgi:hypothetical protein